MVEKLRVHQKFLHLQEAVVKFNQVHNQAPLVHNQHHLVVLLVPLPLVDQALALLVVVAKANLLVHNHLLVATQNQVQIALTKALAVVHLIAFWVQIRVHQASPLHLSRQTILTLGWTKGNKAVIQKSLAHALKKHIDLISLMLLGDRKSVV